MIKWLEGEVGSHIRAIVITAMICVTVVAVIFLWPVKHESAPVGQITATPAPAKLAITLEQFKAAIAAVAAAKGARRRSAPLYAQPAIAVARKAAPALNAFSDAELAQILGALRKPTQPVYEVTDTIVPPSPVPKPSADAPVYDQAYAADVAALNATKLDTHVTVDQVERPPSRIGTFLASNGAGVSYAIVRRGHFDLETAIVADGSHLGPALGVDYVIPHTSLGFGPSLTLSGSHGVRFGGAFVIKL